MKQNMDTNRSVQIKYFSPLRLITTIFIILILISFSATWYARQVSLPRYCDKNEQVTIYLTRILHKQLPEKDKSKRPYIIAAKLLFLVPQLANESIEDYIRRVQMHLMEQCS